MKNNSDFLFEKTEMSLFSFYFCFILVGESYLYYENSPTSILFSRVGKRCFFSEKKIENHENKNIKIKLIAENAS